MDGRPWTADVTTGLPLPRGPKPLKRPPHARRDTEGVPGLLAAPEEVIGTAVATGVPCPGGKAARPDTCFLTHRYVKQEINYLARRIDEVGRYFLALETMVGSGALGPVLERCLKELDIYLQEPEKLEEEEEVQSYIDAAVRLGMAPAKYQPLQTRLSWLRHGRRHEELRAALRAPHAAAAPLRALLDEALRSGVAEEELRTPRARWEELREQEYHDATLALALEGQVDLVVERLRKGGSHAQHRSSGYSLWHVAALGDLGLAAVALSSGAPVNLLDFSGWTPLMLASARQDHELVQRLLDASAELKTLSSGTEVVVECEDLGELEALKAKMTEGRMQQHLAGPPCLDVGDLLLAGEELLLPTFQRVSGRNALHCSVLRPGHQSGSLLVMNELLRRGAEVNQQDELGHSPLFYAASMGFLGCCRSLLRYGAEVTSLEGPLNFIAGGGSLAPLQLLQGRAPVEELLRVEELLGMDLSEGARVPELAELLEGGEDFLDLSMELEDYYERRLLVHRPHGQALASAEEAAALALSAWPEMASLACEVAHARGGYVEFAQLPSAVRMSRLYRQRQEFGMDCEDWVSVVGGCEATLVLPTLREVYQALEDLDQQRGHQLRGVKDNLLSGTSTLSREEASRRFSETLEVTSPDEAEAHEPTPEEEARLVAREALKDIAEVALHKIEESSETSWRGPSFDIEPAILPDVQVWLECSGCVCLLRLTCERVHEVVQHELDGGRWVLEELAHAMRLSFGGYGGGEDEVHEILDAAEAILGKDLLAKVLAQPLQGQEDGWSCTVTGLAAHTGLHSILQILIDAGAPISQPRLPPSCAPCGDYSPLSLAISGQHWPCVSLLLASGADPFEPGLEELTHNSELPEAFQDKVFNLLSCAREQRLVDNERLQLAELSELRRLLDFGAEPSMQALQHLASTGQAEACRLLLDHGAWISAELLSAAQGPAAEVVWRYGYSRLQRAADAADIGSMIQLIEAGLDPDSLLSDKSSLLTYAAQRPNLELAVVLLQGRADPDRQDGLQRYPLLCAVQKASIELTQELLANGASLEVRGEGQTAAHLAAAAGEVQLLEVLLEAGISCGCNDEGDDVAMVALKASQQGCITCLQRRGALPSQHLALRQLYEVVHKGWSQKLQELVDILVQIYPDIVNHTEEGACRAKCAEPTLLMEAVRQADAVMVKTLLAAGARLYPQHVTVERVSNLEHRESAHSIACAVSSFMVKELLQKQLAKELLLIAQEGDLEAMRNLQAEERLGLCATPEHFLLRDPAGYGALDHAVLAGCLDMEIWFCQGGATLSPDLEVLVEQVKGSDLDGLTRRLRAGADVKALDDEGRSALDWCIFTSFFQGLLWECVENSMVELPEDSASVSSKAASHASHASRQTRSSGRLSMRSRKTIMGQEGRRRPLVTLDPRKDVAQIEELLISYGARFHAMSSSTGCLLEPLLLGDLSTVERRARCGANCAAAEEFGLAHMALDAGGVQAAEALVQHGANPDIQDAHGCTVLWRAIQGQLSQLVEVCLEQDVDLSIGLGKENDSSLAHLALEHENPELAIRLLTRAKSRVSCDAADSHGRTVLMRALELTETKVSQVCLEMGSDIHLTDRLLNRTALHIAAESDPRMIPVLLEARADPQAVDTRGRTPLLCAAASGSRGLAPLLRPRVPAGGWATMHAMEAGHFETAAEIIRLSGGFRPTELRELKRTGKKAAALAHPSKMHSRAAELRAAVVMEAYLEQALVELRLESSDFVQRLVQWCLGADKKHWELLELIPERLQGGMEKALQLLRSKCVPEQLAQLLAEAKVIEVPEPAEGELDQRIETGQNPPPEDPTTPSHSAVGEPDQRISGISGMPEAAESSPKAGRQTPPPEDPTTPSNAAVGEPDQRISGISGMQEAAESSPKAGRQTPPPEDPTTPSNAAVGEPDQRISGVSGMPEAAELSPKAGRQTPPPEDPTTPSNAAVGEPDQRISGVSGMPEAAESSPTAGRQTPPPEDPTTPSNAAVGEPDQRISGVSGMAEAAESSPTAGRQTPPPEDPTTPSNAAVGSGEERQDADHGNGTSREQSQEYEDDFEEPDSDQSPRSPRE